MGSAFNKQEKIIIRENLKSCAKEFLMKYGVKKTTVDQLVETVGISKGAFYKFYESKELLFFEIITEFHSELYNMAIDIALSNKQLSECECLEKVLIEVCKELEKSSLVEVHENELPYLLRKIPKKILDDHYNDDERHIKEFIKATGICRSVEPELVSAIVRSIILTLSHKAGIGEKYFDNVLKLLIKGVSTQLLGDK
ncbi:TetR/AcrR family transcriptional regulator [Clostridium uliginosum]|uniref:DNA-binding transcriptional regulator, AcrR family n=1 Tax=Clostridium uliginosum TaxID=119641 RepID=A0A1I1Q3Q4_9CLOT|nr:TetR/AcrR family transcriptional regulator [Clostridium uliginosum]SFD14498.1 DNA-binding transcriptional regulator, AcrR family [Clostridium uliginosum]